MNRRSFCLAGLASAVACSRPRSELRKLRVAAPMGLGLSSLYLSQEEGLFRREGLEVEITAMTRGPEALAALASGRVEVLLAAQSVAIVNGMIRGARVRIVAGREFVSPKCRKMAFLCALREKFPSGLEDLRVLKGKKVNAGASLGFLHFALDEHLTRSGLSLNDVVVLNLSGPEAIAAMLGGTLDAVILFDETLVPETERELVFSRGFAEIHPDFQYGLILFGQTLLQQEPESGARFLKAYFRGVQEFQKGRTPAYLREFASRYNVNPKRMEQMCRAYFVTDGIIDLGSLRTFIQWAHRRGHVPHMIEPGQLVDARFTGVKHA